jgi:hypothetical protein
MMISQTSCTTSTRLDELCSRAVNAIMSGRYDEATELLTDALTRMQQEIAATGSPSAPQAEEVSLPEVRLPLQVPQYYQLDMEQESSSSKIHMFDPVDQQPKIFCAPLVIPGSSDRPYQQYTIEQYQFIVTYNLALSYHLAAASQCNMRKLEVALGLWDLVYRFHWNENLGLVTFHTCAILNNYGHGLRQAGAESPAQACFESLLCALCICVQKKTDESPVSEMDACRTDCFFRTVSTLVLKDPMTAKAA